MGTRRGTAPGYGLPPQARGFSQQQVADMAGGYRGRLSRPLSRRAGQDGEELGSAVTGRRPAATRTSPYASHRSGPGRLDDYRTGLGRTPRAATLAAVRTPDPRVTVPSVPVHSTPR
jgi:hypothetical protein